MREAFISPAIPRSAFLYSPQFSQYLYGPSHPLKNERLALTFRLIEAYGLLRIEGAEVQAPRLPEESELLLFHRREYLRALERADAGSFFPSAPTWGLGTPDNPIFPGVYSWSLLITGASLSAAEAVEEGEFDYAFNMGGGLHHAHAARASGFCYLNDPAIMIHHLAGRGRRVAYLDLDAHHGDGVQEAFYETNQVLTISLHESGETLFPGTGFPREMGEGKGKGYSVNCPLRAGTDDETYLWAFEEIVPPLISSFAPDILVTQLGIDTHRADPLANLSLSLQGFARAVKRVRELAGQGTRRAWIALGGGGYNLDNVPRAWTLVWAIMNGLELDPAIPPAFLEWGGPFGFQMKSLWDPPAGESESSREPVRKYAEQQVGIIKELIFPLHGIKG